MISLSQTIFQDYQIRKTKKQKDRFIQLMKQHYPEMSVEYSGHILPTRNLVIGDVDSAQIVFAAHYDTCAVMPFPNFMAPKNIFLNIAYQLFFVAVFIFIAFLAEFLAYPLLGDYSRFVGAPLLLFLSWLMIFGKANQHTANDNTSGVITLVELMEALPSEQRCQTAFVFFDLEEAGLLGSAAFRKRYKAVMKNKLLINFDCVSDGDTLMMILKKSALEKYSPELRSSFLPHPVKKFILESSRVHYPSDQLNFKVSAAVASFREKRFIGYYMNKIHTNKDCVFDEENISYLVSSMINFVHSVLIKNHPQND